MYNLNSTAQDDLFHNVTVDELLFRGYTPGILKQFSSIISLLTEIFPASLLPPMPDMLLEGKFGLWYGKNNTMKDAYWSINTGDLIMEEYAGVTRYNGEAVLPEHWWPHMGPSPSAHRGGYGGMCHGEDEVVCLKNPYMTEIL